MQPIKILAAKAFMEDTSTKDYQWGDKMEVQQMVKKFNLTSGESCKFNIPTYM